MWYLVLVMWYLVLVMWYLVNLQNARCNNKDNFVLLLTVRINIMIVRAPVIVLVIRHSNHFRSATYYTVIYSLPGSNHIFPHYLTNGTIYRVGGGGSYWAQNLCFDFFYNFCPNHFSI
jgi:hypothetical protein